LVPSSSSSEYVVTSACPENQGLSTANGIDTNPSSEKCSRVLTSTFTRIGRTGATSVSNE
jgi:hypothetical protein